MTGRNNPTLAVPKNQRTRGDFPTAGSVVSYFSPPSGIPATVTIPRPIGHDGVTYAGTGSGFLGPKHDPLELQSAAGVNVSPLHNLTLPDGLDLSRLIARRGLLQMIEEEERLRAATSTGLDAFRDQAFPLLSAPTAQEAFRSDRATCRGPWRVARARVPAVGRSPRLRLSLPGRHRAPGRRGRPSLQSDWRRSSSRIPPRPNRAR